MNRLFLGFLLLISSCGYNGTQYVKQEGESYTYVIVRLEFIKQIQDLCTDANPIENFETEKLQKKAIADCTIANMKVLDINLNQIIDYCKEGADLSKYTEEEKQAILAACAAINN